MVDDSQASSTRASKNNLVCIIHTIISQELSDNTLIDNLATKSKWYVRAVGIEIETTILIIWTMLCSS